MVGLFKKRKLPMTFAHSVIGASHIKNKQPNQDASLCVSDKQFTFIAVSDGHGGEAYFRSDIGSRLAVEAAAKCMADSAFRSMLKNAKSEKEREGLILQLKKSIVSKWNTFVNEHVLANPFDENGENANIENETIAYGATLIAALLTDEYLLALQIGDGNCVIQNEVGEFSAPVPTCEKCIGNITTSLCEKNAIENFRHVYIDKQPVAVFMGTDGICDSLTGEEGLFNFYEIVLNSFVNKNEETAKAELIDYLPRMSEKGSGDDISIALIISA